MCAIPTRALPQTGCPEARASDDAGMGGSGIGSTGFLSFDGAGGEDRTLDLVLTKDARCHCATPAMCDPEVAKGLVNLVGVEPTACRLKVERSATELQISCRIRVGKRKTGPT